MIKGYCFSNVEAITKYDWPDVFAPNISIGHKMRSTDVFAREVLVIAITHYRVLVDKNESTPHYEPRIAVELGNVE